MITEFSELSEVVSIVHLDFFSAIFFIDLKKGIDAFRKFTKMKY